MMCMPGEYRMEVQQQLNHYLESGKMTEVSIPDKRYFDPFTIKSCNHKSIISIGSILIWKLIVILVVAIYQQMKRLASPRSYFTEEACR